MNLFLAVFVVFALVLVGCAVGVIFSNRCIKGSCGGVGNCACGRHGGEGDAVEAGAGEKEERESVLVHS